MYINVCVFFFNDTATTEIYTLSLHDALPILIVGFLNIREEHTIKFLVAVSALLLLGIGSLSAVTVLTGLLGTLSTQVNLYISLIFGNFIAFVGAAGLVVAIKAIVETTKK